MNKLYSLMLILFISIAAFAADRPRSGRLTITTFDNSDIRVEIDGRRYNSNDNYVRINNINSGYHNIQVWRRQSNGFFGGSREKMLYNSSLYVKPEFQVDILIDRYGRAQVQEYDLNRNRRNNRRNDDWDRRNNNGRWEDYDDWNKNNGRDRDDRYDRNDRNNGGYNNGYGRAVSYEAFQSMKQSLRRENFENTRVTLAKDMMERNYFEASQVKEMLQLFSFESNKLDLAKYAYRNTVDKNNFYTVYDVFSYSTSRDELSRYINSVR
jgi:hypothetical protein